MEWLKHRPRWLRTNGKEFYWSKRSWSLQSSFTVRRCLPKSPSGSRVSFTDDGNLSDLFLRFSSIVLDCHVVGHGIPWKGNSIIDMQTGGLKDCVESESCAKQYKTYFFEHLGSPTWVFAELHLSEVSNNFCVFGIQQTVFEVEFGRNPWIFETDLRW